MIKTLEKAGRTEDEALSAALKELGMDRDDVSVEILERARSGFFGIGATPAKIRVSYEVPDEPAPAALKTAPAAVKAVAAPVKAAQKAEAPAKSAAPVVKAPVAAPAVSAPKAQSAVSAASAAKVPAAKVPADAAVVTSSVPAEETRDASEEEAQIRSFLTGLFERMGTTAEISISRRENGGIDVNLSGSGMGALIGRRGETLDAIQHLTNYVVNRGSDKRSHISLDVESYRSKREESLTHLAEKMAEKAIKYKRNMALEPMNSYERHVIHTALQNYKGVTTASTGEEPNRRVVVTYVRQAEEEAAPKKPKTREWA